MKIGFFSDTHTFHCKLKVSKCDTLVFCGDLMNSGHSQSDIWDFLDWFSMQPSKHKIFIAGNHDKSIENYNLHITQRIKQEYPNINYLENSSIIMDGIKFYGSPMTPTFFNWAFMADRGKEIRKYWEAIPNDTDVLITHGPPMGILDKSANGVRCGCEDLKNRVFEIKPKIHAFGHIHEGRGTHQFMDTETLFVNCTVLNERYDLVYDVMYFNLNKKKK